MDLCVTIPKEPILICRPALRKACGGNRNAAKFLSYLLYRASIREEAKVEAVNINNAKVSQGQAPDQDTTITIYRTQGQIISEMDEEICSRTLRDEAIPCLVELGYLVYEEIKGQKQITAYTIFPDAIQSGINHREKVPDFKTMEFYKRIEEERVRKKLRAQEGSEKTPNGQEKSPNGSEKTPQSHGKNSAPSKGSHTSPQVATSTTSQSPKILRENIEIDSKEGEEKLPPNETLPQKSLKECIQEIHKAYDTAMGLTTVWNRESQDGAETLARAGRTDEEIALVVKDVLEDPDQFDLKRLNLKYLSTIIDGRLKAISQRQGKPPQQQSPPKRQFKNPTTISVGIAPPTSNFAAFAQEQQKRQQEKLEQEGVLI